ncbi:MAG: DUF5937 family protein [Phototrophicaceae bacterium]|jgi:DNA-binding transcriptional ArsR family regulator
MLSIYLDDKDLHKVRFAYSPLIELSLSYMALRGTRAEMAPARWKANAQRLLDDVELPYMDAIILPDSYVVDFLTPTPITPKTSLKEELDRVWETPRDVVIKNVLVTREYGGDSPVHDHFLHDPDAALGCLFAELQFYWGRVLEAHWSSIVANLENDVLHRARESATRGIGTVLNTLGAGLTYNCTAENIWVTKVTSHPDAELCLDGRGIQLVPSLFSRNHGHSQINEDWQPMLIYPARGSGLWYDPIPPQTDEALELTLGASKARLLQALAVPTSTSELATQLYLTAGSVSQQLTRLSQAGLVESTRNGSRVYYRLSERGEHLLAVFS